MPEICTDRGFETWCRSRLGGSAPLAMRVEAPPNDAVPASKGGSGDHVHQGGLAGAVGADDVMHRLTPDVQGQGHK